MGSTEAAGRPGDVDSSSSRRHRGLAAVVVAALLAAGVLWGLPAVLMGPQAGGHGQASVAASAPAALPPTGTTVVLSTPPADTSEVPNTVPLLPAASPAPPLPAAPAPAQTIGLYSFEVTNPDGSPARWDPCLAVHYIVNPMGAPVGAMADLQRALVMVGQSTGLQFVDDGTTTAALDTSWITSGPVGANGWPDVLIGWSNPDHTDLKLTPAMGGITEYEAANLAAGGSGLVGAVVVLSAHNDPGQGFGPNARGALLLHELGHAVGLGHVESRTQIMNPVSEGAAGVYGTGDLAGLRILGSGPCLAAPTRSQTTPRTAGS